MCLCPTAHEGHDDCAIPPWAFLFSAVALFAYQTLDNMDGKQVGETG